MIVVLKDKTFTIRVFNYGSDFSDHLFILIYYYLLLIFIANVDIVQCITTSSVSRLFLVKLHILLYELSLLLQS